MQQLVERIAEAPEVRAGDRRPERRPARRHRPLRSPNWPATSTTRSSGSCASSSSAAAAPLPTNRAGVVTRGAAFVIDAVIINLFFTVIAGAATLLATFFGGSGEGVPKGAIAVGSFTWLLVVGVYLCGFWSLAGQTPGMRFLGIRLDQRRLSLRYAFRRLIGIGLSFITLGIGFLGIVFGESRRSWADRMGHTEVIYEERQPAPAPWSTLSPPVAAAPLAAPASPAAGSVPAPEDAVASGAAAPPAEAPPKPGPPTGSAGSAAPVA